MRTFFTIALLTLTLNLSFSQVKKSIAVFSFENKSVTRYANIGNSLAEMITTELVKTMKYKVIERQQLENLLQEFALSESGLVDQSSIIKAGKMIGVDYAVFGAVTDYGVNNESKGSGAFGVNISTVTQRARVALDVRMVNTTTGEIIAAENVVETAEKKRTNVLGGNSSSYDETLVGDASRAAVSKVVALLTKQVTGETISNDIKILLVKEQEVYITAGSLSGVSAGDLYTVIKKGDELKDEDTGVSFGFIEEEIGIIEVVDPTISGGKAAKCKIVSGQTLEKGFIVKKKQ
jgi:curli biogenesis system outer membrane secretion channel CsgG